MVQLRILRVELNLISDSLVHEHSTEFQLNGQREKKRYLSEIIFVICSLLYLCISSVHSKCYQQRYNTINIISTFVRTDGVVIGIGRDIANISTEQTCACIIQNARFTLETVINVDRRRRRWR